ncbi:MAG: PaaI family thioesterase, partial [Chitinophagales bacterium]
MKVSSDIYNTIEDIILRQGMMRTLGAKLITVEKGKVILSCKKSEALTQQHGYLHAGVLATMADTACGCSARTMMPDDTEVLSVEFKMNFLKPVNADELVATGTVLQSGRKLTICEGTVTDKTGKMLYAKMIATMIC